MEGIVFSRQEGKENDVSLRNHSGESDEIHLNRQTSPTEEGVQQSRSSAAEDDAQSIPTIPFVEVAESRQTDAAEKVTHSSPMETAKESAERTSVVSAETTSGKTDERIMLEKGKTLRLLALELFGNREFWVYIYLENKNSIQNPNIVSIGTELTIPAPAHYNINASDPHSVEIAKVLGKKILDNIATKQIK